MELFQWCFYHQKYFKNISSGIALRDSEQGTQENDSSYFVTHFHPKWPCPDSSLHLILQTCSDSKHYYFFFFSKIKLSLADKDLQLLRKLKGADVNSKDDLQYSFQKSLWASLELVAESLETIHLNMSYNDF